MPQDPKQRDRKLRKDLLMDKSPLRLNLGAKIRLRRWPSLYFDWLLNSHSQMGDSAKGMRKQTENLTVIP